MEGRDIYIFDETSPLLESHRNVLFHNNRTDTSLSPSYLVELPEYEPNAPVPPTAILEKRRRSRGASIINPNLQHVLTEQEQEEPLEYFMSRNLTNYRKSILIKDPGETHGIITTETRDNEMEFEVVEPLQGLTIGKVSSGSTCSGNNEEKQTSNIGDATPQGKPNEERFTTVNYGNKKNEVQSLKNRSKNNRNLNFLLKNKRRMEVSGNAFINVDLQSPFANKTVDTSVPLKISLVLIASESDDSLGSEQNWDNQFKTDFMGKGQHFEDDSRYDSHDNPRKNSHYKVSIADSIRGNKHYSEKKSNQLTRTIAKSEVGRQKHSNDLQNKSHEYEMEQHQSSLPAKLRQESMFFQGDNDINDSGRQDQIERKPAGSPRSQRDQSPEGKLRESEQRISAEQNIVKTHKYFRNFFCIKRYHVQLLKQKKQDKSFNMCFAIEKCDIDLKYEGPVNITEYYTTIL